jgi:mono/diheme cytochrome c family protein
MESSEMEGAVRTALADTTQRVRMAALGLIQSLRLSDEAAADLLGAALQRGSVEEQQSALAALGRLDTREAHALLDKEMGRMLEALLPDDIRLDLMEAIDSTSSADLQRRLAAYRETQPPFSEALYGGDRQRGAQIVFRHEAAQCMRCHAMGRFGGDVGPNITTIGSQLSREQILEALVDPNARVAPGFGTVSAMPPMGHILTRREIRDVVEFLSTLE